jgi:hypothetical protein
MAQHRHTTRTHWQRVPTDQCCESRHVDTVKRYDATLGTFVLQACPVYDLDYDAAIYALDPINGGQSIPAGTTYAQIDPLQQHRRLSRFLKDLATGATVVTGAVVANPVFVTNGSTFQSQHSTRNTT